MQRDRKAYLEARRVFVQQLSSLSDFADFEVAEGGAQAFRTEIRRSYPNRKFSILKIDKKSNLYRVYGRI